MSDPIEPPQRPPRSFTLPPALTWLLYLALGAQGFWSVAHPESARVRFGSIVMATFLASLPMIVVHELGHFMAGRIMGMRLIEFSLGVGSVLWQREVRGLKLILRTRPRTGHVMGALEKDERKLARAIFIAGGPAANALLAWLLLWWANLDLVRLFNPPTLAGIAVAANLWVLSFTLLPAAYQSGLSSAAGNDGWMLWRLLRGKPTTFEVAEIEAQQRRSGMTWLEVQARRTRWVLMGCVLFVAGLVFFVGRSLKTGFDPMCSPLDILSWPPFVIGFAAFALLEVWIVRRPWTSFVKHQDKMRASPLRQQMLATQRLMVSQAERWHQRDLPSEKLLEATRVAGDPDKLPWLEDLVREYPQVRILHLLCFDALMAAERYDEAGRVFEAVLLWDDLPPSLRVHFETMPLTVRLAALPDDSTVAECDAAIDALTDDGAKMQRIIAFASTLVSSGQPARLDVAAQWCQRAQQLYTFDSTVHLTLGAVHVERRDVTSARPWLEAAAAATAGSNEAVMASAWLALAAAVEGRTDAPKLLRRSLKQTLPLWLRKRLEAALARGAEVVGLSA